MLLAGGQGSRLGILTKNIAKPAIPFGGKYRIIDFTLSNCYNSGIDTIGVLTQYRPLVLNSYIGIGSPWDLDRKFGGVTLLPPFLSEHGGEWYKGTANAVYQNINFIDMYNPQHVLILSGDHIYKMDYSIMLNYHKEKNAEVTIATIEVPVNEANRFGILNSDHQGKILDFEEKPQNPKSNNASMGVYVFNWELLKRYLINDDQDEHSQHDFGKNIIPKMLKDQYSMYAYGFSGYWKDVGTIESLWQANMDLLRDKPELDLYDCDLRIYSTSPTQPPQFIGEKAEVNCSLINEGSVILGEIQSSVLFHGVYVGPGTIVKDSIIMPNVKIGSNVIVNKSIICEGTTLGDYCRIGVQLHNEYPQRSGITVIGDSIKIPNHTTIPVRATVSNLNLAKFILKEGS